MAKRDKRQPIGFWDQPKVLGVTADLLNFAAAAALAFAAVMALARLPFFSLTEVQVETPLRRVTAQQIEYAVRSAVKGNFFTVDLKRVQSAFEKLPWVRRVTVRRVWPGSVAVGIEEHVATAVWKPGEGENRLVNTYGEVFTAASDATLPAFAGPEGSAPEVLARYEEFRESLAPLGRRLQKITLSPRHAWQLRLEDGLVVDLGRDQPKSRAVERLQRFTAEYAALSSQIEGPVLKADLRYPNGFAVRPVQTRPEAKR